MKRNLYYRTVFRRTNNVKMTILNFFLAICSWPRLMLEVFARKNMGERYFSLMAATFIFIVLLWIPIMIERYENYHFSTTFGTVISHNVTWYLFAVAFAVMSVVRQIEIYRKPSVFDFRRFSLSAGEANPLFYKIKLFGKVPTTRQVSTIWEPVFFVLVGLLLKMFGTELGTLIFWCGIIYSLSYMGAYMQGDDFVMDKIDELISNEEMADSFIADKDPSETRGFYAFGQKPIDPQLRQKVVETFFEEEEKGFRAS